MPYILSIDQGTTSSRAIVFDANGHACGQAQKEFRQYFPEDGWVEHDAMEIWNDTLAMCQQALRNARVEAQQLVAIGITNQRETTVLWDRETGDPLARAIVWQDRRTASTCEALRDQGHENQVRSKTGLLLDPYFSATKLAWLLDNVPNARQRAEAGELAFGTIDSWLLWQLTRGKVHATDATNASRTLLFNIHEQCWDEELLTLFNVPASVLPDVRDSAADFGTTCPELLGAAVPVTGIAGDQQAALVGQACFAPGMVKSTYGTGCFMVMNTGEAVESHNRLLTTVGYRLNGKTTYALEGSIFVAGAAIQWLRDGLHLIRDARETEALARRVGSAGGVYLVPAFTGLGAPWWDPHARGALMGLTRDTGIAEVVTAGLEAVCYQSRDLLDAMAADCGTRPTTLRVDGGMVVNNWLSQTLSDVLGVCVDRPVVTETTALGAAYLAGLGVGLYASLESIAEQWRCERGFSPALAEPERQKRYQGWRDAVARVCQTSRGAN
ncbi:MAG: glycerol kinase [Alcanivorax borkumensis]|jgi:glycerol kinase|uniref:Glycerol kinase n=1 Tax=Alcanivorax borkumensis (strain ATCC 700651 / DSM 11573 / NCIMB 13689 / SK2) TaxID=393595 RepID=GLPK_ALCBS|nr:MULTISPECIES: glycerol kinase GlpK [Alcanivorax]Q0VRN6.1 RecName: Full=Glycerol kinase; AltName: Full=ATP:glycerol 3-phosphotransferase; AltName: Full=Glycerokinase; Short=GK [Alcanivorax borkumensis SK2]OJH08596.1 MAG: glycerol kinase [Alcanivorax borkumensis]EUC69831.1 glycerol kinase [Alcanivorax sp. 97CO-5]PKG01668.1 glycerol kinase [Alcanivorax sp. 97CO-6]CAL16162.1 glycerol kinase [Alcanivorax borkumensis SK2]